MNYSDFRDLAQSKCGLIDSATWNIDKKMRYVQKQEEIECIYKEWRVGGMTGGSCWGTHADQSVSADDEPDYNGLDALLEEVCPNLTFLQYRKISALEEVLEYTVSEYYGNYYEYKRAVISVRALYELLSELNYV